MTPMFSSSRYCHGIVERRNHIADAAFARAVENLQHDEAGGRSDTRSRAAGIEAIAGNDPATCVPWP